MESQVYTYEHLLKLSFDKNKILFKSGNEYRTKNHIVTINNINIPNITNIKIDKNDTYLTIYFYNDKLLTASFNVQYNSKIVEKYNRMIDVYTYYIE